MKYSISNIEFNCGIELDTQQMYICIGHRPAEKVANINVLAQHKVPANVAQRVLTCPR